MDLSTTGLMQAGLSVLHRTRLAALLAPVTRGKGIVFTLHSVDPGPARAFDPNRVLRITPEFLGMTIETVRNAGYDIVSLDEAAERMSGSERTAPFACFTLDDGYRDNRDYAYPVFKAHDVPFAVYVPTAYADGEGDVWWIVLEAAIRKADRLPVRLGGRERVFDLPTPDAKARAFNEIYWTLRARPEAELRAAVRRIAEVAGYDPSHLCRELIMTWDEIRALAADPLVTIGAHTRRHFAVAGLSEDEAREEIVGSLARIEAELGRPCRHFSFPYGDAASCGPRDFALARAAGVITAVTTHKDVLRARYPVTGLPRVSLNGHFQNARYVEVMMTGLPFILFDAGASVARGVRAALRSWRRAPAVPAGPRQDAASI